MKSKDPLRRYAYDVTVPCGHCKGQGRVKLTGRSLETYLLLKRLPGSTGAYLATLALCTGNAMNNRLAALEAHGVATSVRYGVERRYTAK